MNNDRAEMAICLVMVLYSALIVALVDDWIGEALRQSLIVWLPPSLIMLAYRWWLIPVSDAGLIAEDNYGALCAGRE